MSLFKAREWWHAQCGNNEEFDGGCVCVANIDNDPSNQAKIITGSFQGVLRIFLPKERDFKPEDLLLEQELDSAILQLAAGRFSSAGGIHLAVLHPRKLSVYNVQTQGASYLVLNRLYEHYLEHTAANLAYGPFGVSHDLDYLCVQSYDGQLSFFDCEVVSFNRFLPNFLIPGPLCYCEGSDSFITCNAAFELEAYKYKALAAAGADRRVAAASKDDKGHAVAKKLTPDWKVILGEQALDIRTGQFSPGLQGNQCDIIVLCEHNVFVLNASGEVIFQKRLEYHPACCAAYHVPGAKTPGGQDNLLICTHSKTLHVYRHNVLSWAAKTEMQPVAVIVADLVAVKGAIVMLDDTGVLQVVYLGTDPSTNPVGLLDNGKDLDYDAMSAEHRMLVAQIRERSAGIVAGPSDKLLIRPQIPLRLDSKRDLEMYDDLGASSRSNARQLTMKVYLAADGAAGVEDVVLTLKPPAPLTLEQTSYQFPYVSSGQDATSVPVTFLAPQGVPASTTMLITATYVCAGQTMGAQVECHLPMCLFCQVIPPVKNAEYKVTVGTNRAPPPITSIFEDMMAQASHSTQQAMTVAGSSGANVISFQYYSGQTCTILVSKNGGRYRLQSDSFEAMWLILHELVKRLEAYYAAAEQGARMPEGPFAVNFEEALPVEDFFEIVDQYFATRSNIYDLRRQLEDRAVQFRMIEKRLLMRFKDKNPAPLNQLDYLLEETYRNLQDMGNALDASQKNITAISQKLAAAVQLVSRLISYRFGMTKEEEKTLRAYLTPEITDAGEVGWVELTEAAMTHLLRSSLAKNAKEAAVNLVPLAPSKDTARLKKHISLVLERLARGMRISATPIVPDAGVYGGGQGSYANEQTQDTDYTTTDGQVNGSGYVDDGSTYVDDGGGYGGGGYQDGGADGDGDGDGDGYQEAGGYPDGDGEGYQQGEVYQDVDGDTDGYVHGGRYE